MDAAARCSCSRCGSTRTVRGRGYGARGMRDLCRRLLERTPTVCLFVRADNEAGIRTYESIGMRKTISYRSLIF